MNTSVFRTYSLYGNWDAHLWIQPRTFYEIKKDDRSKTITTQKRGNICCFFLFLKKLAFGKKTDLEDCATLK